MTGYGRNSARMRAASSADAVKGRPSPKEKSNLRSHMQRSKDRSSIINFEVNMKFMLALSVFGFLVSVTLIYYSIHPTEEAVDHRFVSPFPAQKVMDLSQFQGEHRESLYWGTYRPHVYFGIRARRPQSLIAGLMWIGIKDGRYVLRHVCQDSDELTTYGWRKHNGRDYGYQVLVDHGMNLTTSFLKSKGHGSGYGGNWAVQVELQSNRVADSETRHLFFYVADEGRSVLSLGSDSLDISENSLLAYGLLEEVGNWQLHLHSEDDIGIHYCGFSTTHFHNLSDLVEKDLGMQARKFGHLQLSDTLDELSNVLVFQISARIPFTIDIVFLSGMDSQKSGFERLFSDLKGISLTKHLSEKEKQFDEKFGDVFNLKDKIGLENSVTGKAAIGNMLGGIGYFYGQSKISFPVTSNLEKGHNFSLYWPAELYTAVPSRSFFPRGFLWDEGFHQLLICRWDLKIGLDIIGHWLDLMNADGWIPREQILGAEALSKVPEEFVLQHPSNGNPPTLFLVLQELISRLKSNNFTSTERVDVTAFLERAFVRLEAWFRWFNITQSGMRMGTYYWHGRDLTTDRELNPKTMSSGLDDYPRASHPSEEERHLDLRCWMLLAADCLHSISELIGIDHGSKDYFLTAKLLSNFEILNQMHFDEQLGAYFDFGNHTEKVRLSWRMVQHDNSQISRELLRETLGSPDLKFVPHVGYVSLFPFIAKIILPDSWILGRHLELISDPSILWSDYGIRSLAKTSSLYMKRNTEHDPPYWRGQIWMNINYLVLSALHYYSNVDGPYRDLSRSIYNELRQNLITNVVENYNRTGYLWEQYDQKRGRGKGARIFTGWTALILLVMSETYTEPWSSASS